MACACASASPSRLYPLSLEAGLLARQARLPLLPLVRQAVLLRPAVAALPPPWRVPLPVRVLLALLLLPLRLRMLLLPVLQLALTMMRQVLPSLLSSIPLLPLTGALGRPELVWVDTRFVPGLFWCGSTGAGLVGRAQPALCHGEQPVAGKARSLAQRAQHAPSQPSAAASPPPHSFLTLFLPSPATSTAPPSLHMPPTLPMVYPAPGSDSGPEFPPGFEPTTGRSAAAPDLPPRLVLMEAWLLSPPVEPPPLTLMRWLLAARVLRVMTPPPPALLPPEVMPAITALAGLVVRLCVSRRCPTPQSLARKLASITSAIARRLADARVAAADARAAAAEARAAAAEARAAAAEAAATAAEARAAQAAADVAATRSWGETFRQKFICEEAERLSLEGALQFYAALGPAATAAATASPPTGSHAA